MRMLKRDLQSAHAELERERERSKNYSLLSRTYYPLSGSRPSYRDLEDEEERRAHLKEMALYGQRHGQQTSPRVSPTSGLYSTPGWGGAGPNGSGLGSGPGGSFMTATSSPKGSPKGAQGFFPAGLSHVSDRGR